MSLDVVNRLSPTSADTVRAEAAIMRVAQDYFGPDVQVSILPPALPVDLILDTWERTTRGLEVIEQDGIGSGLCALEDQMLQGQGENWADHEIRKAIWETEQPRALPNRLLFVAPAGDMAVLSLVGCLWYSTAQQRNFNIRVLLTPKDTDFSGLFQRLRDYRKEKVRSRHLMIGVGTGQEYTPVPPSRWEDVILPPRIGAEIRQTVAGFFTNREMYTRYRIPYRRGVLLAGPPGNGKTSICRAAAANCDATPIYWQLHPSTDKSTLDYVLAQAKDYAPTLLIIEDLDSIQECRISRSAFLNALDGLTAVDGMLILATTNYPEQVDAGLVGRAGRFDRVFELPLPDRHLRHSYAEKLLADTDIDLTPETLARLADGLSFAQMNELRTELLAAALYGDLHDPDEQAATIAQVLLRDQSRGEKSKWGTERRVGFAVPDDEECDD